MVTVGAPTSDVQKQVDLGGRWPDHASHGSTALPLFDGDPDLEIVPMQVANDAATEKSGSAENGDGLPHSDCPA